MAMIHQHWGTMWSSNIHHIKGTAICHKLPNIKSKFFYSFVFLKVKKTTWILVHTWIPKCLHRWTHCFFFSLFFSSCTWHGLFNTLLFGAWKLKIGCSPRNLTHWNGSAVDLVCISSKVPQRPYGSLEVYKQRRHERLPTVQWFNSLRRERPTLREMCRITLWSSA